MCHKSGNRMSDKLETRRMRYFMKVIECGSVRGAADELNMDPSALSRAIATLEQDCGARLLDRHGRGVVATDAGELVAAHFRRQENMNQQLLTQLNSLQKGESGHIDIVAGEGFVDWLMRDVMKAFIAGHPEVSVTLDVCSTDEIVRRITEEIADIGLLFQPPRDDRLRSHVSHPGPIHAYVLKGHPLASHASNTGPLKLADLLPYRGATLHRTFGVRQHIEAAQVSECVRLNTMLTTNSFSALGLFAAMGTGYALTPHVAVPQHLRGEILIGLPMKNPLLSQGRSHVISRQGKTLSRAAFELLSHITQAMETWATAAREG
ncbi:DNA-binding transcriptional regulator, LysR family [Collimonas sp. OK607]|nr:DNA-binding transcriptional regulator, LysR family [Collimonas sp. OK607]